MLFYTARAQIIVEVRKCSRVLGFCDVSVLLHRVGSVWPLFTGLVEDAWKPNILLLGAGLMED